MSSRQLDQLNKRIIQCDRCPRLREHCTQVSIDKRKAYADHEYWGRPVPSFGDPLASIMLVGLAPGAHGANRTGRVFTGDRSGDFLFAGLHRCGFANQPESIGRDDGLSLSGMWIAMAAHCAPPGNKPDASELASCREWLIREMELIRPRVLMALGGIAWNAVLLALADRGIDTGRPRPKFAHGAEACFDDMTMIGCYHVSQQNTFTGRLTEPMLDEILTRAGQLSR